jgi:HIV Tat-specific factor 1
MFTFKELEEDPSLLLDLKEDVREECENLGVVTNVVLYDVSIAPADLSMLNSQQLEEEGIMTVKFKDQLSATACLLV